MASDRVEAARRELERRERIASAEAEVTRRYGDEGLRRLIDAPLDLDIAKENIPKSAGNVLESIAMPVYRPNEFKQVADTALGAAGELVLENFASVVPGIDSIPTPTKDAVKQVFDDRYGSWNNVKRSIETDPVGVAMDVIGLGATTYGGARALSKQYSDDLPISMYESAAKFSTTMPAAERRALVKVLLDEKIPLSYEGVNKMIDTVEVLKEQVNRLIDMNEKGAVFPREGVVRNLKQLKDAKIGQLEGGRDIKIIDEVIDEYLEDVAKLDNPNFTLRELQDFKVNAYKKIDWRRTQNKQKVKNEAYKNISITAKGDIEKAAPGIAETNQRMGGLLDALDSTTRAANRIENRDFAGLDTLIKPGAGAAFAHGLGIPTELGASAGAIAHVLGRPNVKTKMAQMLYDYRRKNPKVTDEALARALVVPYLSQTREDY